jgi:hypothetical protein
MTINPLVVKSATKFVVAASVGNVVKTIVKSNVIPQNRIGQIQIAVASFALAGMASDRAADYAAVKFDEAILLIDTLKVLKDKATTT